MKILKKIIFIIGIMFFVIFFNAEKVLAEEIPRWKKQDMFFNGTLFTDDGNHFMNLQRNVKIKREPGGGNDVLFTLNSARGVYCLENYKEANDAEYKVQVYITIDGEKAKTYGWKGGTLKSWDSYTNGILAYLITQNSNYRKSCHIWRSNYNDNELYNEEKEHFEIYQGDMTIGARNYALWKYMPEWLGTKNDDGAVKNLGIDEKWRYEEKEHDNELATVGYSFLNEARKYRLPTLSIEEQYKTFSNVSGNDRTMGPFKLNYSGSLSLTVSDIAGKQINDVKYYSDSSCKNELSAIKSGEEFYMKSNTALIATVKAKTTGKKLTAQIWFIAEDDFFKNNDGQSLMIADGSETPIESNEITMTLKTGSLKVTKKDLDTNQTITEVTKFRVGNTGLGWINGSNGSYTFDAVGGTYSTVNGVLSLAGLPYGNYIIEEVGAPSGYDLSVQETTSLNLLINSSNPNPTGTLTNMKLVSIRGYVWIDKREGKQNDTDGVWTNAIDGPDGLNGVTVKLMKKGQTEPVATRTTGINGNDGVYIFENMVKKTELANYYVLFDYSELDSLKATYTDENGETKKYINYIPVKFTKDAGIHYSRAISSSVAEKDIDLGGIATTYSGDDQNLINQYGLEAVGDFNASTNLLKGINLGLKELPKADYNITQNLAYVKIDINGYTFTYNYGGRGDTSMIAAPKTNWQKKGTISGYTADIYPSDIAYSVAQTDDNKRIKVYVVYRIDIENTTNYNILELYKESKLRITSLKNYYDGNRYTLEKAYNLDNSNNVTKDFDDWSDPLDAERNDKNVKVTEYNLDKYKDGIEQDKTITSFIEFRVKDDAIKKILENPNGIIEEYPTDAESKGYHEYTRKDYSWDLNITKDDQPHTTANDTRNNAAPYLIFREHKEKERTIKGKVFEDKAPNTENTVNVEKLGDGLYNNNENVVQGIKVDLIEIPSGVTDLRELSAERIKDLQPATRYPKNASGNPQATKETITTDKEGNYNLVGVVPERYFLRFTYGDGTQKICDTDGNEIKTIVGKDYKSTIVKEENARVALNGGTKEEWYKDMDDNVTASVALDNLNTRKVANEATEGKSDVMASTAKMSITIENDDNTTFNMPENTSDQTHTVTVADSKDTKEEIYIKYLNSIKAENEFKGLSFGIIEVPKQDAEIQKLITNVRLTNAQGNVLYNGNPETVASQGVVALSDLDNEENGGSTYVRAEMVEESLYGTNLELTYEVKITNKSDINYYNNEYYWFGNKNANKEVTLTPTDVKDYLDESLTYVAERSDRNRITSNGIKTITIEDGRTTVKAQEMDLKGWKTIYTNKIENRPTNHPTSDKLKIVANRILSNQDDDMEIVSRAVIKDIKHTPDPSDTDLPTKADEVNEQIKIAPKEVHTNGMVKATFTITPPTGENRSNTTIYAIAGILSLIILSTGIVIIKKKVI